MSRSRLARVQSVRFVLGFAAVALAAGSAAAGASWLPLESANRWNYTSSGERVTRLPQIGDVVTSVRGSHTSEVTRQLQVAGGGGSGAFELTHTDERRDDRGGVEGGSEKWFVSRMDERLVLAGGQVDEQPIQIRRPVTLFPAEAKPGLRYDAGRMVARGIDIDMQGEVVGFEDVKTPAGSFRRCLVLRLIGSIGGTVDVGGGQSVAVESGEIETREWYAEGVGLVKASTHMQMDLRMPDGGLVDSSEHLERVLDDYAVAGSPARQDR